MKSNIIIQTDFNSRDGIINALITIFNDTEARTLVVNDKSYFDYIFNLFGFSNDDIKVAWKMGMVSVPPYGQICIRKKQGIKTDYLNKSVILLFPDNCLIKLITERNDVEEVNMIYDQELPLKLLHKEITFDKKVTNDKI
jgi:hypothetical protein